MKSGRLHYLGSDPFHRQLRPIQPFGSQIAIPSSIGSIQVLTVSWNSLIVLDAQGTIHLFGEGPDVLRSLQEASEGPWVRLKIPALPRVSAVACGGSHLVFLDHYHHAWSVGNNSAGQCGQGPLQPLVSTPQPISALATQSIRTVACGELHTLLLTAEGRVFGCGDQSTGQVGVGLRPAGQSLVFEPKRIDALFHVEIHKIACGARHSLFVDECKNLYSCGWGGYFQLGTGNSNDRHEPDVVDVDEEMEVEFIAAGQWSSLCIDSTGRLFCAGLKAWTGKPWLHEQPKQIWANDIEEIDLKGRVLKVAIGTTMAAAVVEDPSSGLHHVYTFGDTWPPHLLATVPKVDKLASTPWGFVFSQTLVNETDNAPQ